MSRRPRLLIVEDDAELRDLYRVVLSVSSYDVQLCADGWDALQFLDQEQPDIIVLDLELPRVSGVDIYKELRAHASTQNVPIIVCTGSVVPPEIPGATVLRKPCTPEKLIATLERALRARQTAWLFVRDEESVRLVLDDTSDRGRQLHVYGPGTARAVFYDTEEINCALRRTAIERTLLTEGYQKLSLFFGDRRGRDDRRVMARASPDRRRL